MSNEKDDGVCENKLCIDLDIKCYIGNGLAQGIDSINVNNNNSTISVSACANCGKGEEESHKLKSCTACKLVKYCSRDCQIAHRPQHKKECRRRAAELYDEKLFKQPPPKDDCPICFIRLPSLDSTGWRYMTCCGKVICSGCCYAPVYDNKGNEVYEMKCAFCRTSYPTSDEEAVERLNKRMEINDAIAIHDVGSYYRDGRNGLPQDHAKACELWHQAVELGFTEGYTNIGFAHNNGEGVEVDKKKAMHYWELAAIGGDVYSRHNLGKTI